MNFGLLKARALWKTKLERQRRRLAMQSERLACVVVPWKTRGFQQNYLLVTDLHDKHMLRTWSPMMRGAFAVLESAVVIDCNEYGSGVQDGQYHQL
mmetsp:Transcript_16951/g.34488  ORF Transcript_16951/g.34488 Transcript_16951/m.34488 type:complete len:96 (-) Transcript_16951:536-823(-)